MSIRFSVVVPGDRDIDLSLERGHDNFYTLPRCVETFVDRFNAENVGAAHARPQTLLRQVRLYRWVDDYRYIVTYELIEDDIVLALNLGADFARARGERFRLR